MFLIQKIINITNEIIEATSFVKRYLLVNLPIENQTMTEILITKDSHILLLTYIDYLYILIYR